MDGDGTHRDGTYHYCLDGDSIIEVRNGSGTTLKQQVWGITYIDELVQQGINSTPTTQSTCDSFYWACQDANHNVMGLVDSTGALKERYEYTPYGQRTVFFSPGANDIGCYAPTLMSRRQQVGGVSQPYGLCEFGHQGLYQDEESGLVYNRRRYLDPRTGRFTTRDPLGYVDGMSAYEYERSQPSQQHDPRGLAIVVEEPVDGVWDGDAERMVYDVSFYKRVQESLQSLVGDCATVTVNYQYSAPAWSWSSGLMLDGGGLMGAGIYRGRAITGATISMSDVKPECKSKPCFSAINDAINAGSPIHITWGTGQPGNPESEGKRGDWHSVFGNEPGGWINVPSRLNVPVWEVDPGTGRWVPGETSMAVGLWHELMHIVHNDPNELNTIQRENIGRACLRNSAPNTRDRAPIHSSPRPGERSPCPGR